MSERARLRIARFCYPVRSLGPGSRLVIWTQGCTLACPGCMSRDTWDPHGGRVFDIDTLAAVWLAARERGADGLTISGGEPLDQTPALAALLRLIGPRTRTRAHGGSGPGADVSTADVLVYTGYETAEATERGAGVLASADAVITGRFDITRPTRLIWRGSADQRLIPLTPLGRHRYTPYLHHEPDEAPMEVEADGSGVRLIGVPRAGDLKRLEQGLGWQGLPIEGVSWRP